MATAENFSFFLPIEKVDKKKRTVSGYASTPALDSDGERVSLEAIKAALPGYMAWGNIREMHQAKAVGVAQEANMDPKGLWLTAKVVDQSAWEKVEQKVYKGFSIGGKKLAKVDNVITEIDLIEISIVDRPANPECSFAVNKKASSDAPAYLLKAPGARDPAMKAVGQMAKAARNIAKAKSPLAAHDGFSLPAKKDAAPKACKIHDKVDCALCKDDAEMTAKREFDTAQRRSAASSGAAMPDGSFPIENGSDLSNAIQAIGRAKNPGKARAHIKSRARALGMSDKIPDSWKSEKVAKRAKRAAKAAKRLEVAKASFASLELSPAVSYPSEFLPLKKSAVDVPAETPSFLTLSAGSGASDSPSMSRGLDSQSRRELAVEGLWTSPRKDDSGFGKGSPFSKKERKLLKSMGVAGQLSYCFDSIRNAQRSLILEAKREGGDLKDRALAMKLGSLAQGLAAVIGQKAEHEGVEALDLSDADDLGYLSDSISEVMNMAAKTETSGPTLEQFLSALAKRGTGGEPTIGGHLKIAADNLKKFKKARKDVEECVKALHAMHKNAYFAKAAGKKKPEPDADGDFDHQGAIEKLQKAFSGLQLAKTFAKAASNHLAKAAGRVEQSGGTVGDGVAGYYTPPPGLENLPMSDLVRAGPGGQEKGSEPPTWSMETPFPGKGAGRALDVMKSYVSRETAEALARAAAAEAESALLKAMPAPSLGGRRPYLVDTSKFAGGGGAAAPGSLAGLMSDPEVMKGVDPNAFRSGDEELHKSAAGRIIGNMLLAHKGAKSVFDSSFHGTAGADAAVKH